MPRRIETILDAEGKKCGGPGTVVSAAISLFHGLARTDKIKAMRSYQDDEIQFAYADKETEELVLLDIIKNSSLSRQKKEGIRALLGHKRTEPSGKPSRKARQNKDAVAG